MKVLVIEYRTYLGEGLPNRWEQAERAGQTRLPRTVVGAPGKGHFDHVNRA
jgi:hypothetical protein